MKRLILLDTHAIVHRAYHALPPSLSTPKGEPINAVYGFTSILLRILKELKPDYIAAAIDLPGPTFRSVAYERYKAHRPETPSDLAGQFAIVREILRVFQIPVFEKEGYEADDVVGTIVKKLEEQKNLEVIIVTGDMDALQLVRPGVKVYAMKKGITEIVVYDAKMVSERYGIKPSQLIDFKGLKGDPSDNIPGVKGIGEKTALELVKAFGSIEGIYKALDKGTKKISETLATKLKEQREEAIFSKKLSTIAIDVPMELKLSGLSQKDYLNSDMVAQLFNRLGFVSLLRRLMNHTAPPTSRVSKKNNTQASLLGVTPQISPRTAVPVLDSLADFKSFTAPSPKIGILLHENSLILVCKQGGEVRRLENSLLDKKPIKEFLEGASFYTHDTKSIIRFLRKYDIEFAQPRFDTMLAAYLVNSSARNYSFDAVLRRELGVMTEDFSKFFDLAETLEKKVSGIGGNKILYEIELPLSRVLADMEERGILIDQGFLKKIGRKVDSQLKELTTVIYKLAGEEFNINSPQQLSRILFEVLQIQTRGLRKTLKGGVVSTGAAELEKLRDLHPLIPKIIEYRELAKLKNTYIDVLPELADPKTGRIHTTFHQTGAASGRLSSSDPNLQNIPILSDYGKEIRKAFIAEKKFVLASFDYSQIELRVAAHLANDKKMIEAFQKGMDIHRMTAAEIYNVPLESVTAEQRRGAKTLNFGVLYGMGPVAFSESTGMSRTEAKKFIDEYFSDFSGIRDYIERTKRFAEEHGYVETLYGRRRYIPEIFSSNWQLKREAERMAVSHTIQGTATGDIVKMAMIQIDQWIKKEKLGDKVRMLLQVHDELLFEIKEEIVDEVKPKIKKIMEGVVELKVPILAEHHIGKSWEK